MRVVGIYSFNHGREVMEARYPDELSNIYQVIQAVDASQQKTKISEEKTSPGAIYYSPQGLNSEIKKRFYELGWQPAKVPCDYPTQYYIPDYIPPSNVGRGAFREMDFVKNKVGVEVQFGKYAFMVYNVAAKMTIFHRLRLIDVGVEVVPVKELQAEMSTGVSYFEQFVWDLDQRGVSDIDIPVLVFGITKSISQDKSQSGSYPDYQLKLDV